MVYSVEVNQRCTLRCTLCDYVGGSPPTKEWKEDDGGAACQSCEATFVCAIDRGKVRTGRLEGGCQLTVGGWAEGGREGDGV